jgi:hypothetical protein
MTHPIIKTENYLLAVDELSDVKDENIGDVFKETKDGVTKTYKIIAHLPLNNAPTLEGVPLLPPLENEGFRYIHSLAFDEAIIQSEMNGICILDLIPMFINGYNKAKENYDTLLKEVLMEFDLAVKKHLLLYPIEHSVHGKMCDGINEIRSKIIQSLQQPKYPVAFECDVEGYKVNGMIDEATVYKPKTITNSQLTQLVGKYIYL